MSLGEYKLLDTGNQQKLEQVGKYRLVRPALTAYWQKSLNESEWQNVNGIFQRNSSGGGKWRWGKGGVSNSWNINLGLINFLIKPTNFGHLGFFAEQYENWQWLYNFISNQNFKMKTLNLFAYSGGSSIAMAKAGADVCHLDAAKGMITWGKDNQILNPDIKGKIRWIADDAVKFTAREIKRGNKYNGIVLDPPSFGRGSQGQVWKIETDIIKLLKQCDELIDKSKPFFVILSCHTPGFTPISLSRLLNTTISEKGICESGEMRVPEVNGRLLPAGIYSRLSN